MVFANRNNPVCFVLQKRQETLAAQALFRCFGLKMQFQAREGKHTMSTPDTDKRRYGIIEVRQLNARTFHLTINRQLWSEVEWSAGRRTWCVQDAAGRCLAHCDHIVGTNIDQRTAIALAKAMIIDGRMPTPEEAEQRLREGAGAMIPPLADRTPEILVSESERREERE
jgi:hypothetical protein